MADTLHALHMVLLCALLLLNVGFLAPIVIAFVCAMTYVAYRDIYLGQSENTKLEAKATSVQISDAALAPSA